MNFEKKSARFRFYEELNDFLPDKNRKTDFPYAFHGTPSVKDAVEAIGVPHTEVDLVVVNGRSVAFDYHLQEGDRVAVYPVFESIDITPIVHLRAKPLRDSKFVLDTHLGKLARRLRLLGFDCRYETEYDERDIIDVSIREERTILTRDRGLLKSGAVSHGYWIRSTLPDAQVREVVARFDLRSRFRPFLRCMLCNGLIQTVEKSAVRKRVPSRTAASIDEFFQCDVCGKVYWKGSHYEKMSAYVRRLSSD